MVYFVLPKGMLHMRSWRRVGKTEAKSLFVGQSFNFKTRACPPSVKRTNSTGEKKYISFEKKFTRLIYRLNVRIHPKIALKSFHSFGSVLMFHNPTERVFLDDRSYVLWMHSDARVFWKDFDELVWQVQDNSPTKRVEKTKQKWTNFNENDESMEYIFGIGTHPFVEDRQTTMTIEFNIRIEITIDGRPNLLSIVFIVESFHFQTFEKYRQMLITFRMKQY